MFKHHLKYNHLINSVKDVQRTILTSFKPNRFENDAEHSFDLASMALYLIKYYNLPLNIEKVLAMALFHDVVEVYSGDICSLTSSPEDIKNIKTKEKECLELMKQDFYFYPYMIEMINEFESLETEEAQFVKALDKIVPAFVEVCSLPPFRSCKMKGISKDKAIAKLVDAKELAPCISEVANALIEKVEEYL